MKKKEPNAWRLFDMLGNVLEWVSDWYGEAYCGTLTTPAIDPKGPKAIRVRLGRGLFRLQMEEQIGMPYSRPMPDVAAGVCELRVKGEDGAYRAFYYTASAQGILVFHAFVKQTQRTPPLELGLARKRLMEVLNA